MEYRSIPLGKTAAFRRNRILLVSFLGCGLLIIALQLMNLTVVRGQEYSARAADNRYSRVRLSYPRGNILDHGGRVLATNQKVYAVTFSPYGMRDTQGREILGRVSSLLADSSAVEVEEILSTRPRWTRHLLGRNLSQHEVLPFLENPSEFRGIRVHEDFRRVYPESSVFGHVVGYVGKIQPGEEGIYTRPRYLLDSDVGRSGLERHFEDRLAGHPGYERLERDARGRRLAEPELLESSRPGENLYLTLDADLQRVAMDLFRDEEGEWRRGSIIVMEAGTGELRVLASRPTFDPLRPGAAELDGEAAGYVNLAIRGLYPPGSTFKVVAAAAALQGGLSSGHTVHCGGRFQLAGWSRPFWCNQRHGHGPVSLSDSLKMSCNVYYYDLAHRWGFEPLRRMGEAFGLGEPTGIDLPGERGGQLSGDSPPGAGETLNLVLGQGEMLATPLQTARAFAALANGGYLPRPHVVRSIGLAPEENPVALERRAVGVDRGHIGRIVEGLWRAVNEPGGTAYKAGFPREWEVCGKTGTAENHHGTNDAWFAGFFPRSSPRYVVVVHIEDTDRHGGEEAGPVARAMIAELMGVREVAAAD